MIGGSIELRDLADHLTLTTDAPLSWPDAWIEYAVTWHRAEPDVGLFDPIAEITHVTYNLNPGEHTAYTVAFSERLDFVSALYRRIGSDIAESESALHTVICKIENAEYEALEPE